MKNLIVLMVAMIFASCSAHLERAVRSPVVDRGEVTFTFYDPAAKTVQVGGDWPGNNWTEGDEGRGEVLIGLMNRKNGMWSLTIHLPSGRYRYRFLVNESLWVLDPSNPRIVDDGLGSKANMFVIP